MVFCNKIRMIDVALIALCVFITGCAGSGDDQPELGLVKGTVTFKGFPLVGAMVTFTPDNGRPANGKTDENGNYELIYIRDTPGCKIGHNIVSITTAVEGENEMEAEGDEGTQKIVNEELPAKYNTKTELEAVVKAGENAFRFEL